VGATRVPKLTTEILDLNTGSPGVTKKKLIRGYRVLTARGVTMQKNVLAYRE